MAFPVSWQEDVFITYANDVGMTGKAFVLTNNFFHASTELVGQGLCIVEVPLSHSDTPQSEGLLTSDQSDAETSI
jgi:hypothetical protein